MKYRRILAAIAAMAMMFTAFSCGKDETAVSETVDTTASIAGTDTENSTGDDSEEAVTTTGKSESGTDGKSGTEAETEEKEATDDKTESNSGGEIIIDPEMGLGSQSPAGNLPYYDEDIKRKLGIEVELTGSNAEQAQQYTDACRAAYPDLPWYNNGTSAGVDPNILLEASGFDAWAEGVTDESVDAIINEKLAGRNYRDLSIYELAEIIPYASRGTSLGCEIKGYFDDLTYRNFNAGGYYID